MALDPYSPCPAGTGKKLKFCCSDLIGELEKIDRMIEGEQLKATIDHVNTLESRCGKRACLLATKSLLQLRTGQFDEAKGTIGELVANFPDNPVGLAEKALLAVSEESPQAALIYLQHAIENLPEPVPSVFIDVVGSVGEVLISEGAFLAGRAVLSEVLRYNPDAERPAAVLRQMSKTAEIPLLLKDDRPLLSAPAGVRWKDDAEAANKLADEGRWLAAAQQYQSLVERFPDAPELWYNLATLRIRLADDDAAVEALRRYAKLPVPLDDASEADALANYLAGEAATAVSEQVWITYPIRDLEQLLAVLAADKRLAQIQARFDSQSPPPKVAYLVADRVPPSTTENLSIDNIPSEVGQILVYGRETDREARLELLAMRGSELDQARRIVEELCGETLGDAGQEQVVGRQTLIESLLTRRIRPPRELPQGELRRLITEHYRRQLLEVWPEQPQPRLDGKTPASVAGDPAYYVPLLGLVLQVDAVLEQMGIWFDANDLRQRLRLPIPASISAEQLDLERLPLVRLSRVELGGLDDQTVAEIHYTTILYGSRRATRSTSLELLNRPAVVAPESKPRLYQLLTHLAIDSDEALRFTEEGRAASQAVGKSCAAWDLQELELRLARGETEEFGRLMEHLQRQHMQEPGVREALTQLLVSIGAIGPDGRPRSSSAPQEPSLMTPEGPAEEPGKIWTPESERAAAGKSGLWIPGSD